MGLHAFKLRREIFKMTTPQDIQAALDRLYERAIIRLDQINVQMGALGQAAPEAIGEIRNYIQCSNTALQSHVPEASAVDMDHVVFHLKAALSDIANGECAKGEIQWCIDELLRRGLLSAALL